MTLLLFCQPFPQLRRIMHLSLHIVYLLLHLQIMTGDSSKIYPEVCFILSPVGSALKLKLPSTVCVCVCVGHCPTLLQTGSNTRSRETRGSTLPGCCIYFCCVVRCWIHPNCVKMSEAYHYYKHKFHCDPLSSVLVILINFAKFGVCNCCWFSSVL